jgi:hypothetical protein
MTRRDVMAGATLALATDLGAGSAGAAQAGAGNPVQAAWLRYQEMARAQRERFLASDLITDPQIRAQGLYFLQSQEVSAFNFYVAPRQQYPALYVQSIFMPLELSWGLPNPDFLNRNGFIDCAHTYRIHGNRRGNQWATIQVFRGFWGDEVMGNQANIDFDDVPMAADGSFEIFIGPNPPADAGGTYWVKVDPAVRNAMLATRETAFDWSREGPMDIHIECLDRDLGAPIYFDEAELAARIDKAAKYAAASFEFAMAGAGRLKLAPNAFEENTGGRQQGGNPLGHWINMLYDIAPDEALVIEMPVVPARYWGFQLGSVWGQTTDYSYHQSSINGVQAHIDADGRFRAVLSLSDPGVPNWLDPAGLSTGVCLLRFYKAEETVTPTVTRVKLAEVRGHLPKDTPAVTAEARRAALDERRIASLRRYGQ